MIYKKRTRLELRENPSLSEYELILDKQPSKKVQSSTNRQNMLGYSINSESYTLVFIDKDIKLDMVSSEFYVFMDNRYYKVVKAFKHKSKLVLDVVYK